MIRRLRGGVTAPKGFIASGIHAGIKKADLLDLALIVSEVDGPIAGVFTKSNLPSAPVILDKLRLKKRIGRAVIVNSGNANACTGTQGLQDAEETAVLVANRLGVSPSTVFVGSTGVIGPALPMAAIRTSIPELIERLRRSGHREAAKAIMTTDTTAKEVAVQIRIGGRLVTIGGMAKGSGMIHPDMATMLAYVTTDAVIKPSTLQTALQEVVDASFNSISIDGETSPNDTVLCLANGCAKNAIISHDSTDRDLFQQALLRVCQQLAMKICRDGEGSTKLVEIRVQGARNQDDAKMIANTLATSPLVKTAFFGEDPNWGRILAAIGRAGPVIRAEDIHISFDGVSLVERGRDTNPQIERRVQRIMKRRAYAITIVVGKGRGSAKVWTTDLSYDYVKINASYRS